MQIIFDFHVILSHEQKHKGQFVHVRLIRVKLQEVKCMMRIKLFTFMGNDRESIKQRLDRL